MADLTVEEADAMPGAFRAFRYTDGSEIMGDYAWIAADFECDGDWGDDPKEVEEVVMVPVTVRKFMCHDEPEDDEDG